MLDKMRVGFEKNKLFSIDFSSKIDYKSTEKIEENDIRCKNRWKSAPWDGFLGEKSIFGDFWAPRGDPKIAKNLRVLLGKGVLGAIW